MGSRLVPLGALVAASGAPWGIPGAAKGASEASAVNLGGSGGSKALKHRPCASNEASRGHSAGSTETGAKSGTKVVTKWNRVRVPLSY